MITNKVSRSSFFLVFTVVYICFLIDLVIGNVITIDDLFGILDFKFLKNCMFYTFFCGIVIKQSIAIALSSRSDYYGSVENLDELTETVLLKIRIIRVNSIIVCLYALSYIIGNITIDIYYSKSNSVCSLVFNLYIDFIILFSALYNLKPDRLLFLYEAVALTFNEFNVVYKVRLISKNINSITNFLANSNSDAINDAIINVKSTSIFKNSKNNKRYINLNVSKALSNDDLKNIKKEETYNILILNPFVSMNNINNNATSERKSQYINSVDDSNTSISSNSLLDKTNFSEDTTINYKNEVMSNFVLGKIIN